MDQLEIENTIRAIYKCCLRRQPNETELTVWGNAFRNGTSISEFINKLSDSEEYKRLNKVIPYFLPGHYYSPIVSPDDDVREYMKLSRARTGLSPAGIDMNVDRMKSFFIENAAFMSSATFERKATGRHRYYSENGGFPLGDAVTLRAMVNHLRPKRIIEVGSGFSTACMLDTLEEISHKAEITCVEPYPDRLKSLLRSSDTVEILESPVQSIALSRFAELEENDILFIDSTHVLKTGSDVHYELFDILPVLKPGVMIHFHDLMYPFEYPPEWVFDTNYSWNEAYGVRAFLMFNNSFVPFYSSSLMYLFERPLIRQLYPSFPENPGANLWIKRQA